MNLRVPHLVRRSGALFLLSLGLFGCAGIEPAAPEDRVRIRAQERVDALRRGDFDAAYAFLSPGSRVLVTAEQYRAGFVAAPSWKGARVAEVHCETSEKCLARIAIEHVPLLRGARMGTIESHMDETWLLDGGQWWHVYRP
ncbi:MAG: DUF4864 domain-containing protein [Burkholderiales bacterium]|nr:DUF4864 domain-containing protein [Burkholderiales bacterium]